MPLRSASYLGKRPNQHRRGSFLTQGQDIRITLANHKTKRQSSMGTTLPEVGVEIETRKLQKGDGEDIIKKNNFGDWAYEKPKE